MRWRGREKSTNVEDRRSMTPARVAGGGGLLALIIAVGIMLLGGDPRGFLGAVQQQQQRQAARAPDAGGAPGAGQPGDEAGDFIAVVLRETEKVWTQLFREYVNGAYRPPKLVIFSDRVRSGCGLASAAMGPFYCPADQQVYIDPTFFDQLENRHNAPGDFAQAYVIAHEVGHHVQKLLGFSDTVDRVRASGDKAASNRASVRLELQADYLAGVWAHHAHQEYNILEEGDIAEAMNAANQIGDDTLQRQSQGFVVPGRFTHGSSAQRVRWFKQGLASGDFNGCQQLFELDYKEL
ncbi:MAG: neutral zinc metallopeptidase [Planctomycetota bacterium]